MIDLNSHMGIIGSILPCCLCQYFHVAYAADDMPVVVSTHGDLLSVYDRVRVRVHLGEHLGISPEKQIFDIPDGLTKKLNSYFFCDFVS